MNGQSREEDDGAPVARYNYPEDLVRLVRERWGERGARAGGSATDPAADAAAGDLPLPDDATLLEFISAGYQASMLHEEERPVTFRAILAEPELFDPQGRAPASLQRLEFARHLPFGPGQLRRLSVAADPQRTLIGVYSDGTGGLRIWGLVNSGIRWLRDVHGGRRAGAPLPPAPVIRIDAPGSIAAYRGEELIGSLEGGRLSGSRLDVFESQWLPRQFLPFLGELVESHRVAREHACDHASEKWATLEPDLPRRITERVHKRFIAMLSEARHGGTFLFIPQESMSLRPHDEALVDFRYRFADERARRCFPTLIVDILNRLARNYGGLEPERTEPVGWQEFETTNDEEIQTLDEALFELAHLFAGLAEVDGAVVFNTHHELLGFGGMISGRLPEADAVWRALDLEGDDLAEAQVANVGARHRAAYRLVGGVPGSVAIVISQDGGVRFVTQRGGRITYWEQG